MLARLAGNLFWLSRYVERIESTARLINVHDNLLMDLPQADPATAWSPLVYITGMDGLFHEHFDTPTEANVTFFLISDPRNPSSIANALEAIRNNLRSSRDTISRGLYEALNQLCLIGRSRIGTGIRPETRRRFLNDTVAQCLAVAGALEGSMSRDQSLLFLRMGSHLERADMTSRMLDVRSATLLPETDRPLAAFENRQWVAVLRSVSALQMYRTHVRRPVNGPDVVSYLLQDKLHPRAYRCCLNELDRCLGQLPHNRSAVRRIRRLERELVGVDVVGLAEDKPRLHAFIDTLQLSLARVGNAVADAYFPD